MRTNSRTVLVFLAVFCSQVSFAASAKNELALIVDKVECEDDGTAEVCRLSNPYGSAVSSLSCEDKPGDSNAKYASIDIKVVGYDTGGTVLAHQFGSMAECKAAKSILKNRDRLPQVLLFTSKKSLVPGYSPTGTVRLISLVEWERK